MHAATSYELRGNTLRFVRSLLGLAGFVIVSALVCGCTSLQEYIHNGFKVGPNYGRPSAPVANDWIDADDQQRRLPADCDQPGNC